jgi:hypothetical protein
MKVTISELLTPRTLMRMMLMGPKLEPPTLADPASYVRAATEIVGDGPEADRRRVAVFFATMDLQIDPQIGADVCMAIEEPPTADARVAAMTMPAHARVVFDGVIAALRGTTERAP